MTSASDMAPGLDALNARVREELGWIDVPAQNWVPPIRWNGQDVRDVVIVGAGMAGLAASGALLKAGIRNHVVYDAAPERQEGPWVTYGRMETLRSPKTLPGPCLGIPVLTFRAWYEYRFGRMAWEALGFIPRALWMDYLVWIRTILDIPVENETKLLSVTQASDGILALHLVKNDVPRVVLTRRLVLATGRDGLGGPYLPPVLAALPATVCVHSSSPIDFDGLAGKRVVVIGGGASAMDNAAEALEHGAARVDMLVRRPDLPRINRFTGIGSPGVTHGFAHLPDDWKWRFLDYATSEQVPPPRLSTLRVSRHDNAFFHLNCAVESASLNDGVVRLQTSRGAIETDFVIAATGFSVDLAHRPELAAFADNIRFWQDRFMPEQDNRVNGRINPELALSPDLDPAFAFQPRDPSATPGLGQIHCFCYPATLSHGKISGDIPAISDGADRLARGIAGALFVADRAEHFQALQDFSRPELQGNEWTDSPLPG